MLISCGHSEEKILRMSNYNSDRGEMPEFMLRGYEDYRIKLSREDVRLENKVTFEDISDFLTIGSSKE